MSTGQQTADRLAGNIRKTIVSTGGGFLQVTGLKEIGTTVYLPNEFDQILERIHKQPGAEWKITKLPLLQYFEKSDNFANRDCPCVGGWQIDVGDKSIQIA